MLRLVFKGILHLCLLRKQTLISFEVKLDLTFKAIVSKSDKAIVCFAAVMGTYFDNHSKFEVGSVLNYFSVGQTFDIL